MKACFVAGGLVVAALGIFIAVTVLEQLGLGPVGHAARRGGFQQSETFVRASQ